MNILISALKTMKNEYPQLQIIAMKIIVMLAVRK